MDASPAMGDGGGSMVHDAGGSGDAGGEDAGPVVPPCDASSAPAVGKLGLSRVVDGLSDLVAAAQPPGSTDWYLVQQNGLIRVFANGSLRSTPFLDLTADGATGGAMGDERGLLGLAFHPDYASNGLFYVMLTPPDSNVDQVREYARSSGDAYVADPSSRRDIVVLPDSATNHNGGTVLFGPDGFLYVGTGDGGGGCNNNRPGAPQDVSSLFGKILRLDLSKPSPFAASDNPFVADGDARVLHYGLRNPFRFGFDRLTGDLYIGDVGQDNYEEIDFAPSGAKGLNFGWADFEGNASDTCSASMTLRPGSTHTPPVFVADRGNGGTTTPDFADYNSIIGGIVYRGTALPQIAGAYFFGDYVGARMGALYQCGTTTSAITPILKSCDVNQPTAACFAAQGGAADLSQLAAIVEGRDGEMYFVVNRNALYKVVAAQ